MGPGNGHVMSFDRYAYPGMNVLVNKFGITDSGKLSDVERMSSAANASETGWAIEWQKGGMAYEAERGWAQFGESGDAGLLFRSEGTCGDSAH